MPLQRRLPKRGFTNIFKKTYSLVNLNALNGFEEGAVVDAALLETNGLIKNQKFPVKLLGDGELTVKLTVKVQAASKTAAEKIAKLGGSLELLTL
jgi:large subunit ribosomal protein L15